jgi:hypothetical protein
MFQSQKTHEYKSNYLLYPYGPRLYMNHKN